MASLVGIGVYFYCTECDYFDKTPDPELSTDEELAAEHQRRATQARAEGV